MSDLVTYEFKDAISTITMDDGKANVVSPAMVVELNAALDQAEANGGVVVLQGREGLFSGGFDMGVFKRGDAEEIYTMLNGGAELAKRLLSFPLPTLAACSGHAMAMGLFLLLSCDVRIGSNAGRRFAANEVSIGLTVPRFAIAVCRQRLTPAAFNCGLVVSHYFGSDNAIQAGILDLLEDPEDFAQAVSDKAKLLGKLNMAAHKATKLRMRSNLLEEMQTAIEEDRIEWKTLFPF